MKMFLKYLLKSQYRKILILLFIRPQKFSYLSKRCRVEANGLHETMAALVSSDLVEILSETDGEIVYRIRPDIRQKVGSTFSRVLISIIFLGVTSIVKATDKKLDERQAYRIYQFWNDQNA